VQLETGKLGNWEMFSDTISRDDNIHIVPTNLVDGKLLYSLQVRHIATISRHIMFPISTRCSKVFISAIEHYAIYSPIQSKSIKNREGNKFLFTVP
jgi:hypothetical protein